MKTIALVLALGFSLTASAAGLAPCLHESWDLQVENANSQGQKVIVTMNGSQKINFLGVTADQLELTDAKRIQFEFAFQLNRNFATFPDTILTEAQRKIVAQLFKLEESELNQITKIQITKIAVDIVDDTIDRTLVLLFKGDVLVSKAMSTGSGIEAGFACRTSN